MTTTSLSDLFASGLPINRKERYFTGTVLPALLCAHSMQHLHRLTEHVGLPDLDIRTHPADCTIEFFTEYSPVESAVGQVKVDFAGLAGKPKDTPDVVILSPNRARPCSRSKRRCSIGRVSLP